MTFYKVFACINQYMATDLVIELRTFDTITFQSTVCFSDILEIDGKQIICVIALRLYS